MNKLEIGAEKIHFKVTLADRLREAMKAKMETKYLPAARFEDIGKPFYQTDSRILKITNFFLDIRSNIKKHKMVLFISNHYDMWRRKRKFLSMSQD